MTNENHENVYATFLIGDDYVKGTLALHQSIKDTGTNHPFVVFTSQCSNDVIALLTDQGCFVHEVDRVAPPKEIAIKNQKAGFSRWNDTFSKLSILSFTQFNKIVLLDSDMMVVSNIDTLFSSKHMSAVAAGHRARPDWVDMNSGLLVIKPSIEEFDRAIGILEEIGSNENLLSNYPTGIGDQDIIQLLCQDWPLSEQLHLPESFNLFQDCLTRYEKWGFIKKGQTFIIHFELNPKPWDYSFADYAKVVYRAIRYRSTAEINAISHYRALLESQPVLPKQKVTK